MLDVCLLGTGGMMPLPNRWLTSCLLRYKGSMILIDCGEGTQIPYKAKGWGFKNLDIICFTHYHADHIAGLPGMLLTLGNSERTEPITLIGPKGLKDTVEALRVIARELPFEIEYIEFSNEEEVRIEFDEFDIRALKVDHRIDCYGYSVEYKRDRKFDIQKAEKLNIPRNLYSSLQKEEIVEFEGKTYTPDMVLGDTRKGFKVSYITDTRPTKAMEKFVEKSDLFIAEGMYFEEEKYDRAKKTKHMMMSEAAKLAQISEVKELWLTHFSPAVAKPIVHRDDVRRIFRNTYMGKDGIEKTFKYE
ncbi:MAG: ribonuclease Z [Clostridia bacterium]|jgi:ribonuclease Z|nr:ribonuclease Z [Clostridia bacterium]